MFVVYMCKILLPLLLALLELMPATIDNKGKEIGEPWLPVSWRDIAHTINDQICQKCCLGYVLDLSMNNTWQSISMLIIIETMKIISMIRDSKHTQKYPTHVDIVCWKEMSCSG